MPDNKSELASWSPKCEKCGRELRLVGLEPDEPGGSIHTYECECGEVSVIRVTRM